MSQRLDKELVERGLFASRAKAQEAIEAGVVTVNALPANRASAKVSSEDEIAIVGETLAYVSRAGLKMEHAIRAFGIDFSGRILLDIGSSTGGFTDCALQHGAAGSFAVDVGRDQLAQSLREDGRVTVMEGLDFRDLDPSSVEGADIASFDVSFISVAKLVDHLAQINGIAEVVCLVKPQFECGKDIAHHYRGVPLDQRVHVQAISLVVEAFTRAGFCCQALCASPIRGQNGNIEYLAHFKRASNCEREDMSPLDYRCVVKETFDSFGV